MRSHESRTEVIRLCSRHQAKCLRDLELNGATESTRQKVKGHFAQLRADLVDEIYQPGRG